MPLLEVAPHFQSAKPELAIRMRFKEVATSIKDDIPVRRDVWILFEKVRE
jgi:hypothetical protein